MMFVASPNFNGASLFVANALRNVVFPALLSLALGGHGISRAANTATSAAPLQSLHAKGTKWVGKDGVQIDLKGVNLGNWLIMEFWMMGQHSENIGAQCGLEEVLDERFGYRERERLMKLFRDNWITKRDWDMLPKFGFNTVRLPFIWSVIEDEKNPRHLRSDAWDYLDDAIHQAESRGMYVILDLHGAAGNQSLEHHSGCIGKNRYWDTPEYQERTVWLWEQIASRYKDRASIAGYSLLNEPWGTTDTNLAAVMKTLYERVRAVDPNHVILLPGYYSGIDSYGKPGDHGMRNVAFEMHFYPGFFGWDKPGLEVHRDWLTECGSKGRTACEWNARLTALDTPFYIGEFQPWSELGGELGGQITRASYDAYAKHGWAATAWSYKVLNNAGGQGRGSWGLVTNAEDSKVPQLDFAKAPLEEIESLFKLFGSVTYEPHRQVMQWMSSAAPPEPFLKQTMEKLPSPIHDGTPMHSK